MTTVRHDHSVEHDHSDEHDHNSDNVTNDDYDDNAYSDTITDDIPTDREVESYSESESSER